MELCDRTAIEIKELVERKQVKAIEVVESCLARVEQVDGRPGTLDGGPAAGEDLDKVHAFISLTADLALQQAARIDQKIAAGERLGRLAGVPFTAKDIFCVKDTYSTAASRILANFKAPYNATPVQRMLDEDGVLLGKVNLDEFTYGSSSESSAFQPSPRNPWNTQRVPGGSSGGNTAAVAAGECPLSLGTDTAGSIRQPAAFCGVVGLKPTYGRVSRYGLIAFGSSLDCPGPVARSVKDAGMMLQVIAGMDGADSTASTEPVPDYLEGLEAGVKGMRIGISPDYAHIIFPNAEGDYETRALPKEIEGSVQHAAEILASMGAEIIEGVPMPNTRYGIPAYFVISRVEASSNLHRFDGVKYGHRSTESGSDLKSMYRKSRSEGFGPQPKLRILMGLYVSSAQYSQQYYRRALNVRAMIRRDFDRAFDPSGAHRLDALLTPTTPTTAFPMGELFGDSVLMQYADQLTVPANHAGTPAISVPAGLDGEGLPLGIQFLGADFEEAKLLRIARAYESATSAEDWRKVRPKVLR